MLLHSAASRVGRYVPPASHSGGHGHTTAGGIAIFVVLFVVIGGVQLWRRSRRGR